MCDKLNDICIGKFNISDIELMCRDVRLKLRRRFPGTCRGRVDDAVSDAVEELLRRAREQRLMATQRVEVARYLYVVAWRKLRGQLRRHEVRRGVGLVADMETVALDHAWCPDVWVQWAQLWAIVQEAIDRIAPGSAPYRGRPLRVALHSRLTGDLSDQEAADLAGISRETLNRAKARLRVELQTVLGVEGARWPERARRRRLCAG